jgi:hypothetical protein
MLEKHGGAQIGSLTLQDLRLVTKFLGPIGIQVETERVEMRGYITATN